MWADKHHYFPFRSIETHSKSPRNREAVTVAVAVAVAEIVGTYKVMMNKQVVVFVPVLRICEE